MSADAAARDRPRPRRARTAACVIAGACACAAGIAAAAASASADEAGSVTIEASGHGLGGVRASGSGGPALTLRLKGERMRVDLGREGSVLIDLHGGAAWLLAPDGTAAIPVARTGFEALRVDPASPCRVMQARCERAPADIVAGVAADGWHYRDASGRGPDGTSRGTLWIDPASGLVLAFHGEVPGRADRRAMRALTLTRTPIDDALRQPPGAAALRAGSR